MLAVTYTFLFFIIHSMISRRTHSMILPGTEVRWTRLVPQVFLFSLSKPRGFFLLFQSLGTSLDLHDFSNTRSYPAILEDLHLLQSIGFHRNLLIFKSRRKLKKDFTACNSKNITDVMFPPQKPPWSNRDLHGV